MKVSFVLIGLIGLIVVSAMLHRTGMTKIKRRALVAGWLALSTTALVGYTTTTPANAAGVRCEKFVSENFIGPIASGTCRKVYTTYGKTGWKGNIITGYHKNLWIKVGNQRTVWVDEATSRGARDMVLAVGCGAAATKFPAAGAACATAVTVYWYFLEDTFQSAADQGKCTYLEFNGVRPVKYFPTAC